MKNKVIAAMKMESLFLYFMDSGIVCVQNQKTLTRYIYLSILPSCLSEESTWFCGYHVLIPHISLKGSVGPSHRQPVSPSFHRDAFIRLMIDIFPNKAHNANDTSS